MPVRLLRCLARSVAKHGGKLLCNLVPGAEALYEIAADAYQDYRQDSHHDELHAEVQALAQASPREASRAVAEAVRQGAGHLPAAEQQKLAAYLSQVPAMIRRSLRRPSDPTGTTVPANLALRQPDDLLPFLPARPPRFARGERPLPGVDWVLEEPLGVGGFGEVWKAHHAHLQSKPPVALKFCLDAASVRALRNEAGVLDRVMQHGQHSGIVPLLQTYLSADPPCLEYEYVEGGDLSALIRELHARGQLKPAAATRLLLRLAEIVAAAHRADPPIVHGDLKPANVLVRRTPEGKFEPRVTDFGIGGLAAARAARETRRPTRSSGELLTEAVRGAYTPLYASPQQMMRRPGEPPDPRDDVHALGVIWYQLLTGDLGMLSVPTDWREQVQKRGLGSDLTRLLAASLAPQAEARPVSAAALAQQLQTCLKAGGEEKGEAAPAPRPAPPQAPRRRSSVVPVALAALAVLAGAWFVWHRLQNRPYELALEAVSKLRDKAASLSKNRLHEEGQALLDKHRGWLTPGDQRFVQDLVKETKAAWDREVERGHVYEGVRQASAAVRSSLDLTRCEQLANNYLVRFNQDEAEQKEVRALLGRLTSLRTGPFFVNVKYLWIPRASALNSWSTVGFNLKLFVRYNNLEWTSPKLPYPGALNNSTGVYGVSTNYSFGPFTPGSVPVRELDVGAV
jgi:serine/threonine protein kinase